VRSDICPKIRWINAGSTLKNVSIFTKKPSEKTLLDTSHMEKPAIL
jgi:hypothetical protein